MATYHVELSRDGPGLLLRDLRRGDAQAGAVAAVIAHAMPDVLALTGIDHDDGLAALRALRDRIAEEGARYPHLFTLRPNRGLATGDDLNGDGRTGGAEDAQGYGRFAGDGGMAVLSRYPLSEVRDLGGVLWAKVPGSLMSAEERARAGAVQRLSSTGHWVVGVMAPGGAFSLMLFSATPPVFDGPEDRNGRRNADEIRLWQSYLDGAFGSPPDHPFVILGNANLDPADGEGRHAAIAGLLADARLQDPLPRSAGGAAAADPAQKGDPALDTADWREPTPGNLRVDYVLPSADWRVRDAGVIWPEGDGPPVTEASRHRLVWVDLVPP